VIARQRHLAACGPDNPECGVALRNVFQATGEFRQNGAPGRLENIAQGNTALWIIRAACSQMALPGDKFSGLDSLFRHAQNAACRRFRYQVNDIIQGCPPALWIIRAACSQMALPGDHQLSLPELCWWATLNDVDRARHSA
jgi:hypothetical protein